MEMHTPSPWVCEGETIFGQEHPDSRYPNRRTCVATVCLSSTSSTSDIDPEVIANARLIAAAPDLLAACQAIDIHWSGGNFSRDSHLWDHLRAAIVKATV